MKLINENSIKNNNIKKIDKIQFKKIESSNIKPKIKKNSIFKKKFKVIENIDYNVNGLSSIRNYLSYNYNEKCKLFKESKAKKCNSNYIEYIEDKNNNNNNNLTKNLNKSFLCNITDRKNPKFLFSSKNKFSLNITKDSRNENIKNRNKLKIDVIGNLNPNKSYKEYIKDTSTNKKTNVIYTNNLNKINKKVCDNKYNIINNTQKRIQNFNVELKSNKNVDNNLVYIDCSKLQNKFITDEIITLSENICNLKIILNDSSNIKNLFKIISLKQQREINILIEELIGYLKQIADNLIKDYKDCSHMFLNCKIINFKKNLNLNSLPLNSLKKLYNNTNTFFQSNAVYNEYTTFNQNLMLLNDIITYNKACFLSFQIIIKEMPNNNYSKLFYSKLSSYVNRARYNTSYLICKISNLLKLKESDNSLYNKFTNYINNNFNTSNSKYKHVSLEDKLRSKSLEYKCRGLNNHNKTKSLIEYEDNSCYNISKNKLKPFKSILFSTKLNKLLKYTPKDVKNKIISHCIIHRYNDKFET